MVSFVLCSCRYHVSLIPVCVSILSKDVGNLYGICTENSLSYRTRTRPSTPFEGNLPLALSSTLSVFWCKKCSEKFLCVQSIEPTDAPFSSYKLKVALKCRLRTPTLAPTLSSIMPMLWSKNYSERSNFSVSAFNGAWFLLTPSFAVAN